MYFWFKYIFSAGHLGACPFMPTMLNLITQHKWNYETMLKYNSCFFCCSESLNPWYSCLRRSSMVNFHPGLLCIRRHLYYLVKLFVKFNTSTMVKIAFAGERTSQATLEEYHVTNPLVPKPHRTQQYIRYGKILMILLRL